jgi:hypothetical protein
MVTSDDISQRIRRKPFQPFRIIVGQGQRFDIFHPDLVVVGVDELTIGHPRRGIAGISGRVTRVSLEHITALEDLPRAAASEAE